MIFLLQASIAQSLDLKYHLHKGDKAREESKGGAAEDGQKGGVCKERGAGDRQEGKGLFHY